MKESRHLFRGVRVCDVLLKAKLEERGVADIVLADEGKSIRSEECGGNSALPNRVF